MRKAARDTWAGHHTPARAWYFSTDPERPIGAGRLVTIERAAGKLHLRDAATGDDYDVLGATAKLWLADDVVPTAAEITAASMTARYIEAKLHNYLHWVTSGRSNEPGIALLHSRLSCERATAAQAGQHDIAAALAIRLAEIQPAYDAYRAVQDDELVLAKARNALSRAAGWDGVPVTDPVRGAALEEAKRDYASRLLLELDKQVDASFRIVRRHAGQLSAVDKSTGATIGTATRHQNTARTGYFWGVNVNGRGLVEDYKYQAEKQLRELATAEQRRRMLADRADARAARAILAEPRRYPTPAPPDRITDRATGPAAQVGEPSTEHDAPALAGQRSPDAEAVRVVIVPCGLRKSPGKLPAGRKYIGSYHAQARRAAAAVAARTGATVYILSALHGLLTLDQEIDDYELTMGQPGSVTAVQIAEQAAQLGITDAAVTVIAGKKYADVVTTVWPHAVRCLDRTAGIGAQMARMAEIIDRAGALPGMATPAAVPALLRVDAFAPPAPAPVAVRDLKRGDVCAPGSFTAVGITFAEPVLIIGSAVPALADFGPGRMTFAYRVLNHARGDIAVLPGDITVHVVGRDLPARMRAPIEYPMTYAADALEQPTRKARRQPIGRPPPTTPRPTKPRTPARSPPPPPHRPVPRSRTQPEGDSACPPLSPPRSSSRTTPTKPRPGRWCWSPSLTTIRSAPSCGTTTPAPRPCRSSTATAAARPTSPATASSAPLPQSSSPRRPSLATRRSPPPSHGRPVAASARPATRRAASTSGTTAAALRSAAAVSVWCGVATS